MIYASWNEEFLSIVGRVTAREWAEMERLQRQGATPREASQYLGMMRGEAA